VSRVRCPRCGTQVVVTSAGALCPGCGHELRGVEGAAVATGATDLEEKARKDISAGKVVLAINGALALVSLALSTGLPLQLRLPLAAFLISSVLVGAVWLVKSPGPSFNALGQVVLGVFVWLGILALSAGALTLAAVVILFAVCASGAIKF